MPGRSGHGNDLGHERHAGREPRCTRTFAGAPLPRASPASRRAVRKRLVRAQSGGLRARLRDTGIPDRATVVVALWIALNAIGFALRWDPYPFILLNLAFSTQAAYAAPLILLAQTRQAERDKALAIADAKHRDALARESHDRADAAAAQAEQLRILLDSNTRLTEQSTQIAVELELLTRAIHARICEEQLA